MSTDKPKGVTGAVGGWIKAIFTSIIGLATGAVIMYLTPLVNSAIKPAKPVANFATQVAGLTVQLNNRSTGGVEGWWDFGDGSALEPFDRTAETVKHTYAKPGTYTVKLTLKNLIDEQSDRTAQVAVEAGDNASKPEIAAFDLAPVGAKQMLAPALLRLSGAVKNADYCVLSVGDERPIEILDGPTKHERYIAYEQPGTYLVRYAAVNGKQVVEQTRTVTVRAADDGTPRARLQVVYEAVRVDRFAKDWMINCDWQGGAKDAKAAFRKERQAYPGCTIVSAELLNKDAKGGAARNVKFEITPDKKKVIVTGELVRSTGLLASKAPPHWLANLKVVMERRSAPETLNHGYIAMAVNLNSTTKIPMQPLGPGWEIVKQQVTLQLWDGRRKALETTKAMANAAVTLNNQTYMVSAQPQADSMVLTIAPVGPAIRPVSFERNPLLPKK